MFVCVLGGSHTKTARTTASLSWCVVADGDQRERCRCRYGRSRTVPHHEDDVVDCCYGGGVRSNAGGGEHFEFLNGLFFATRIARIATSRSVRGYSDGTQPFRFISFRSLEHQKVQRTNFGYRLSYLGKTGRGKCMCIHRNTAPVTGIR